MLLKLTGTPSVDASFGDGGVRVYDEIFPSESTVAHALAASGESTLLVAGRIGPGNSPVGGFILKLDLSGNLVTTFGTGGVVEIDQVPVEKIALSQDGSIFASGRRGAPQIFHFNADGSPDLGFSDGDGDLVSLGSLVPASLGVQSDGRVILGGFESSNDAFGIIRYNADGLMDIAGFGSSGRATKSIGAVDTLKALLVMSDDSILAVGESDNDAENREDWSIVKFNPNGQEDTSFGTNGATTLSIFQSQFNRIGGAVRSGNNIVVGGFRGGSEEAITLAAVTISGEPLTTFGTDGIVSLALDGNGDTRGLGMLALEDGRLLAYGRLLVKSTNGDSNISTVVAVYDAQGSPIKL